MAGGGLLSLVVLVAQTLSTPPPGHPCGHPGLRQSPWSARGAAPSLDPRRGSGWGEVHKPRGVGGVGAALRLRGGKQGEGHDWDEVGSEDVGSEEFDSKGERKKSKDKYEFEPPPDEERYTGGIPPPEIQEIDQESSGDISVNSTSEVDSDQDVPLFVEGQVRQGGRKLTFKDGIADFHGQILNTSHPDAVYVPDFGKGQTWADSFLRYEAYEAVNLTEQDGPQREYLRSVSNKTFETPVWEWNGFKDRLEAYRRRQENGTNESCEAFEIFDFDEALKKWDHAATFKYPSSEHGLLNSTRRMGDDELRAPFVMPKSQPPINAADDATRMLEDMKNEHRWRAGELPLELNDEDREELQRDQEMEINEQFVEACEAGATGMMHALIESGANLSYAEKEDGLTGLHYAALNGHCEIVKYLLEHGCDVNCTDEHDRTPMHWAAYNGQVEAAKVLLDAGAHVMAKTKGGTTPYGMAALFCHGEDDVVHWFRKEELKFNPRLVGPRAVVITQEERKKAKEYRKKHPLAAAYGHGYSFDGGQG